MTIDEIYDAALYLAEKTDDATGYIDDEYKKMHKKKAEFLIKQCIRRIAHMENIKIIDPDFYYKTDDVPLDSYIVKNIIPCYTAAMLCAFDGENEKYNILIYEYQRMLGNYKHTEEAPEVDEIIEGMW